MKTTLPELALERLLLALERDLVDATDEEVLAAAKELGMNPAMKGSAAFMGVTLLVRPLAMDRIRLQPTGFPKRRPKGDAPASS